MKPTELARWQARVRQGDAILAAESAKDHLLRRALDDSTSALKGALDRLLEATETLRRTRRELGVATERFDGFLQFLPVPTLATSRIGDILDVNPEARDLLNISRHPRGKSLLLFLDDRGSWMTTMKALQVGDSPQRRVVSLRLKDRAAVQTTVCFFLECTDTIRWCLLPLGISQLSPRPRAAHAQTRK